MALLLLRYLFLQVDVQVALSRCRTFQIDTMFLGYFQERDVRRHVSVEKGDFVWGPSIWRKRLRHFQSFTRNGIIISVSSSCS